MTFSGTSQSGILFDELERSPTIRAGSGGMTAQRRFLVAWDDYATFVEDLVGRVTVVGTDAQFSDPLPFPGPRTSLFVVDVQIEPFDPDSPTDGSGVTSLTSGTLKYLYALITAQYKENLSGTSLDFGGGIIEVPNGTYLTYEGDLGVEAFLTEGRGWVWFGGGANAESLPDDTPIGIVCPTGEISLTWHRVPVPPSTAIRSSRGKVNSGVWIGADPETVLYRGCKIGKEFQFFADPKVQNNTFRVQHVFSQIQKFNFDAGPPPTTTIVGWNHFYRKNADPHWEQVIAKTGGQSPFLSANFAALFQMGP